MAVYAVRAYGKIEEFIEPDSDFSEFGEACRKSEPQFLTKDRLSVGTLDSGGLEFPDLIVLEDVYLLSDAVIEQVKDEIEDYVFLKPVEIRCDLIGKKELYWLTVPPKIDCLDLDKSRIDYDWDFGLGILPILHSEKTVIDEKLTGRYGMFKALGIDDNNIYVTERIRDKMQSVNPEGILFISSEEE